MGPGSSLGQQSLPDTVLIAEDDPIFRQILETWLEKWHYRVTAVENGLDAWGVLQQKDAPQMAILDWMMPGLEGIELCRRIRTQESGPYKYVLLLTAKGSKEDVVAGLESGADDYLTKPFDVNELRARVRAGKRILELQGALLRVQTELQFQSAHDHLTGLWNRGAIAGLLHREAQRGVRTNEPLGVMMADVDHFKRINDSYGHQAGDAVLTEVARRMVASVRNYDYVGRYGGEEFLIVLGECTASDLTVTAERMRASVSGRPVETESGSIAVTVSVGLVASPARSAALVKPEDLLRAADMALYRAKEKGRNRVECASKTGDASQAHAGAP
ncbi:MAG: GGDEF domain-containing response regulator [Terriglobales bacterium]